MSFLRHASHICMIAHDEEKARAFLEPVNITLYVWPLGCALYTQHMLAQINGDNELQQATLAPGTSLKTFDPTPFMRKTANMSNTEVYWGTIMWLSHRFEIITVPRIWVPVKTMIGGGFSAFTGPAQFDATALAALSHAEQFRALEEHLSSLSAFTFGVLVQCYTAATLQNSTTGLRQYWSQQRAMASGSRKVLQAALHVNGLQLLFSSISVVALASVVLLTISRFSFRDCIRRDAGVLDLTSLLNNSSLPNVLRGDNGDYFLKTQRRKQAGSITVV